MSEAKSINVVSVSCPTAEINGMGEFCRRANHFLFVEGPKVLDRAATAGDDQQIGPRHRAAGLKLTESANGLRDLAGGALALNRHRPDDDMCRAAVFEPMKDVADDGAGR